MRTLAFITLLAVAACGSTGDEPTADEREQLTLGGGATTSSGQLNSLADSMFDFDPTIDPTKTAEQNATAIGQQITTNLAGCGAVAVNAASVTVNFGPPPGCTLPNGAVVSGQVALAVSKANNTITIAMTFTGLVIDSRALTGTASFATSNGSTFAVTAQLTTPDGTQSANFTVVGSASAFTIDGTSSVESSGKTTSLKYTGVKWKKGACYPEAGTVEVAKSASVTLTMAFSATTPTTGKVTVTQGRRSWSQTLPAYGKCPSADGG